ncbi:FAD-binding oxidoreductase [uncultured Pseudoteredinibacter sp.]|uniref:NAD(P)/FAD-dependent oxidoreductase n=1 Tax=uncultured Pseudoteredinibacter sp. TaxID=1641701 RepID=UPI00260F28DE|nr:FAD-binding oxidoreductase [uncultured Pseudoteredinibacter sp.]
MSQQDAKTIGYEPSYYSATAIGAQESPQIQGEVEADVCVVGGGYTGLSAALHLAKKGYKVVLLEAERVGWGASGRNGGHCGVGQRKDQEELEAMVGKERAAELWQYSLEAVDTVAELVREHNIDCDLKQGILHVASKPKHAGWMQEDVALLREDYGYEQCRYVDKYEVSQMVGSKGFHGGQIDERSLHLHPLNFALGLARACREAGVQIFEKSRVSHYQGQDNLTIHCEDNGCEIGQVKAKFMVMGCNGYLGKLESKMAGKIMPINNFVLATEPLSDDLARELIRDDTAVADTLFVINYWKLSGDNRLIFGGGENYSSQFPADIKNFVRKYMLRIYPQLENTKIDYGWGGTLAITLNRMPHFGRLQPNILFAQGYSGHGVPTAIMGGKLLAEAVSGTVERFDVMANVPTQTFPGGTMLRWPGLVAGMLFYSLMDKL